MKVVIYILLVFILLQSVCCQDVITTIAGTGSNTYSGDGGAATSATLIGPYGVALDASGRILLLLLFAALVNSNSCNV